MSKSKFIAFRIGDEEEELFKAVARERGIRGDSINLAAKELLLEAISGYDDKHKQVLLRFIYMDEKLDALNKKLDDVMLLAGMSLMSRLFSHDSSKEERAANKDKNKLYLEMLKQGASNLIEAIDKGDF